MKKIISIISSAVFITISSYIVVNALSDDNETYVETKKVVEEKEKKDYEYLTIESDNIESVLKNEVKKEEIIEPEEEIVFEPIIEEPIVEEVLNGFIEEEGNIYYYENNERVIGQKEIDQDIYYFDSEGVMQKDVVIENCYYAEDGKLFTGFKDIDGNTFYFTIDGFVRGSYEVDNKKYYFDEDGHLIKNSFYDEYYLDENGVVVDMEIIVKFGVKVQKVATEVQEKVKSTVETMTGLNVAVVNVSVSGVVKEVKAEEEE